MSARQLFNLISTAYAKESDVTFGHIIAYSQQSTVLSKFFSLLSFLLAEGISATEMLTYLSKVATIEKTQYSIAHVYAYKQNINTIIQYFLFLAELKKCGATDDEIRDHLNIIDHNTLTMFDLLVRNTPIDGLYKLICQNIFYHMKNKKMLPAKKEDIFAHIQSLPHQEKIEALQNALTPTHPLYHFFNIQRGYNKPSLEKGTFAKIKAELNLCNAISHTMIESAKNIIEKNAKEMRDKINALTKSVISPAYTTSYHIPISNTSLSAATGLYPIYEGQEFINPTMSYHTPPMITAPYTLPAYYPSNEPPSYSYHMTKNNINNASNRQDSLATNVPVILDISKGYIENKDNNALIEIAQKPLIAESSLAVTKPMTEKKESKLAPSLFTPKKVIANDVAIEKKNSREKQKEKRQLVYA